MYPLGGYVTHWVDKVAGGLPGGNHGFLQALIVAEDGTVLLARRDACDTRTVTGTPSALL